MYEWGQVGRAGNQRVISPRVRSLIASCDLQVALGGQRVVQSSNTLPFPRCGAGLGPVLEGGRPAPLCSLGLKLVQVPAGRPWAAAVLLLLTWGQFQAKLL